MIADEPYERYWRCQRSLAVDSNGLRALMLAKGYTPHSHRRGEEIADKRDIPGYRARRWVVLKRRLSLDMIRRLHVGLGIPSDLLISSRAKSQEDASGLQPHA